MYDLKIVLADDHPLFLRGITDFLRQLGFKYIHIAKNGLEAFRKIQDEQPDIAILDIEMPYMTGIEVAQSSKKHDLKTKFVLISYQHDSMIVQRAGQLNISGYILKEDSISEIEKCIKTLFQGDTYFSENISKSLPSKSMVSPIGELTETEKKVLRLIADNLTSKAIAEHYGVSVRTIEKHRSNIIEKLGLPATPTALLIWARENRHFL